MLDIRDGPEVMENKETGIKWYWWVLVGVAVAIVLGGGYL